MGLFFSNKQQAASTDFTVEKLPHTRKEQFFDICKIHYMKMFGIGGLLCLFFIPSLLLLIAKDVLIVNITTIYKDDIATFEQLYFSIRIIASAVAIATIMIFSIGLAGILKVFRRLLWNEPVFFKEDFVTGIKENLPHFLINSLILGLFNLLRTYLELIIRIGSKNNFLAEFPLGILLAVIVPIGITVYFTNAYYKNKYLPLLNLSINIYLRGFVSTLLCCLSLYVLLLLNLLTGYALIYKYVIIFIVSLLGSPFIVLMFWENEIRLFDRHVNALNFPDYYCRGIYPVEKQKKKKRNKK